MSENVSASMGESFRRPIADEREAVRNVEDELAVAFPDFDQESRQGCLDVGLSWDEPTEQEPAVEDRPPWCEVDPRYADPVHHARTAVDRLVEAGLSKQRRETLTRWHTDDRAADLAATREEAIGHD